VFAFCDFAQGEMLPNPEIQQSKKAFSNCIVGDLHVGILVCVLTEKRYKLLITHEETFVFCCINRAFAMTFKMQMQAVVKMV